MGAEGAARHTSPDERDSSCPGRVWYDSLHMEDLRGSESQTQVVHGGVGVIEPKIDTGSPLRASDVLTTTPETLAPAIEALLLSVDRPISAARLAEALGLIESADEADSPIPPVEAGSGGEEPGTSKPTKRKSKKDKATTPTGLIQAAVDLLNNHYEHSARSFRIQAIAGGYRVMTLPKFAPVLEQYHGKRERHGVSRAALETLAIIAYKQPMTRASLEAIRGVACGEVLRSLIERRLITIVGRAEELGRPMLYGTTKAFLETFGLATLKDLPTAADLRLGGAEDAEQEAD